MTQVNALFNKVANKGRFTLTEVEGYGRFVAKVVSPDVGMNRIVSSRSFTRQM